MSVTENRRTIAATWVVLLTGIWVIGVPALVVAGLSFSFSFGSVRNPEYRTGATLFIVAAAVAVLLPLTATVVAYRAGRAVMGSVYLVLTVLLALPAALTVYSAGQDLGWIDRPAAPQAPGPPGHCVDHSGGDSVCPGG